jgi:hypothetical protein
MDAGGARRHLGLSNHRCIRPAATFSPADAAAPTRGSSAAPARTAALALDAAAGDGMAAAGFGFPEDGFDAGKTGSLAAAAALRNRSLCHPRVIYRGGKPGAPLRPAAKPCWNAMS